MLAESVVKKFRIPLFCLITALAAGSSFADVVINEINYNSPDLADAGDWIELHNTGGASVDVSGWKFDDNPNGAVNNAPWVIPSNAYTTIPAGGFLVVYRDFRFPAVHGGVSNRVGTFEFGLGSTDVVQIFDGGDNLIDSVSYFPSGPWSDEPDGLGPSLALIDPTLDNSLPKNWTNSLQQGGTPGAANGTSAVTPNETPAITISSPLKHSFYDSGASITIETVTSDDGTIVGVEFFADTGTGPASIDTVTSEPFDLTGWEPEDGSYSLTAVATDDGGLTGATTSAIVVTITSDPHPASIVINEINYNSPDPFMPYSGESPIFGYEASDWIELHNPTGAPADISGWLLRDQNFGTPPLGNDEFVVPAGTIIPAGGYLVIVKDIGNFNDVHAITNFVGEFDLLFSYNESDTVDLRDSNGWPVDVVRYKVNDAWPMEPNGGGPSLCLDDPSLDNELKTNWSASAPLGGTIGGTPGVTNGKLGHDAPTVSMTSPANSEIITPGSSVTVQAMANDDGSVVQVEFFADANDGMGAQSIGLDSGSAPWAFSGWMPLAGFHTITAVAKDDQGVFTTSASVTINVTSAASPGLVINEINYDSLPGVLGAGDWIEIHNPTAAAVDISNWKVKDASPTNVPYTFPLTTAIPSGGFLVVCGDEIRFDALHSGVADKIGPLGFGLGETETVSLLDPSDAVIDSVSYLSTPPWAPTPNGQGPTLSLIDPTLDNALPANWTPSTADGGSPGVDNGESGTTPNDYPHISITSPAPFTYVPSGSTITVEGVAFDFGGGTIESVEFFADNGTTNVSLGTASATSNPYESPSWTPADATYTLSAVATDNLMTTTTSPGVVIQVASSPPARLVISEINYSSPLSPNPGDWIELHNPTSAPVVLEDWQLADGDGTLDVGAYTITSTLSIPAGGYFVIVKDFQQFALTYPSVPALLRWGPLGFGMSSGGETVALYDPNGDLMDSVAYEPTAPWPTSPAGGGPTLSRIDLNSGGSDPTNWVASAATGGTPAAANDFDSPTDTDMDDMTDDYENANGLNPNVNDADENLDGDSLTNIEELAFGTAPNDASSDIDPGTDQSDSGFIGVSWASVIGKTYHIYGGDSPASASMTLLRSVVATSTSSRELFADPVGIPRFFFEVRVDQ